MKRIFKGHSSLSTSRWAGRGLKNFYLEIQVNYLFSGQNFHNYVLLKLFIILMKKYKLY
jgi:hypothetical protein